MHVFMQSCDIVVVFVIIRLIAPELQMSCLQSYRTNNKEIDQVMLLQVAHTLEHTSSSFCCIASV